jgi:hypothetical protein
MRPLHRILALSAIATLPACFHATIETGRPASAEVLTKSFAASWIYGLVPPSAVSTASRCPNGVATVETQLSFVNQLVGLLTLGIYTPMEIKVTCAGRGSASAGELRSDIAVNQDATDAEIVTAVGWAADQAVMLQRPVFVSFEAR